MLKRALVPIFLASLAGLALLTFLAASVISSPDPGLSRSNQTINRVTKPDPQLPALPGAGRVEIRGDETGRAPAAALGSAGLGASNALAGPDTFYGNETLYPLIDAGTMIIPLPGGARVEIRGGETTYVLTDHLGSARVVLREDNTVSGRIEYTPFGERPERPERPMLSAATPERCSNRRPGPTIFTRGSMTQVRGGLPVLTPPASRSAPTATPATIRSTQ